MWSHILAFQGPQKLSQTWSQTKRQGFVVELPPGIKRKWGEERREEERGRKLILCDLAVLLPGMYTKNRKQDLKPIYPFTAAKIWKQPTYPTGEQISKIWFVLTTEYYATLKRKYAIV